MAEEPDLVDGAASIARALAELGLTPVLVGGMALVVLGSRRVTRGFDFVVARPEARLAALLDVLYDRGLALASRLNAEGDVTATIDNRRVAGARLRLDAPASATFFDSRSGLRVDLLFDYPLEARALADRATTVRVRSVAFRVASEDDLLRLKRIALEERTRATDAEDVAFLEARRGKRA